MYDVWGGILQERQTRKTSISMLGSGSRGWTTNGGAQGNVEEQNGQTQPLSRPIPYSSRSLCATSGSGVRARPSNAATKGIRASSYAGSMTGNWPACDHRMTPGSRHQAFVKSTKSSREDFANVGLMNLMASREFQRKNSLGLNSPRRGP